MLDEASILIEGDRIAAIGSRATLTVCAANPLAEVIDCRGQIIIPGMVNTHTHLFQTLLKGLGDDRVLRDWFTCMTGPSAVELTAGGRGGGGAAWLRRIHPLRRHRAGRFHVCPSGRG